ncbi:hypothetical protein NIES4072_35210 [Nostoc commune NIES-4072]|uniref:PEP-CTERM protein-sorting domain-containing protein n=1 Tax=Nostoc commune NIES-4072 TaxID=2005467 RepID=A0A2R5FM48_NOSCO|nr:PEP-CTERM sorting domain-containing protein [Nostoc commune]BBD69150.1 hypothetical protein NIES4070_55580 [Nostoc commune HK-02]GBG19852.1 hypothetical protein NIES4072_35210 [Nostoc commune NIES-4072]
MRYHLLSILLGLATAVAVSTPLNVQAQSKIYQFVGGKESVNFDAEALDVLKSLGLTLASVENTAVPAPGYTYAFDVIPTSANSSVQSSTFTFNYDDATKEFIPISGTVDLTGSLFFNVDRTKLALPPQLELGDLSAQPAVDLDVIDKANTGLPIFTLEVLAPPNVDLENRTVTLNFNALASQEFSDFLVAAGASQPIAGLKLGEIQGDRNIALVPEPGTVLAILMAASSALALGKRHRIM